MALRQLLMKENYSVHIINHLMRHNPHLQGQGRRVGAIPEVQPLWLLTSIRREAVVQGSSLGVMSCLPLRRPHGHGWHSLPRC